MYGDIVLTNNVMHIIPPKRNKYSVKQMFRDLRKGKNLLGLEEDFLLRNFNSDSFKLNYALDILQDELDGHEHLGIKDDFINERNELEVYFITLFDTVKKKIIAFAARPWKDGKSGKWQYVLGDIEDYV